MTPPGNEHPVIGYESGFARHQRSRSAIEQGADFAAYTAIVCAACAFVAGWIQYPTNGLALLALLICALVYVSARIVRDNIARTASIQMFISAIPALICGILILLPMFLSVRQFGWRFAGHVFADVDSAHAGIFALSITWFIIARVYGTGPYDAPMSLRSVDRR